jgi:FAD dependent oxidoreductase TIGR03364
MLDALTRLEADVCVVGAGVIGLAHAIEARRRGLRVVVLEQDSAAVGASVRNFGHLFFASQPDGPALSRALRSRERWLEIAGAAGLELVSAGTLIVARAEDELAVLAAAAAAEPARQARLLTPAQVGALAPLPSDGLSGALHSPLDLRVDPRAAVARLARWLEADREVTLLWKTTLGAVSPGVVEGWTTAGARRRVRVAAPWVFVCPGPDYRTLAPELAAGLETLTRCRLQMLRVRAPGGRRYGPALATGLSLIRYPAFADRPETAALRARLEVERPELIARGIHLLVTQRPDGDLIIGDSHTYADTLTAFGEEAIDELLLGEAARLLGADTLSVRERWLGIYPSQSAPAVDAGAPFRVTSPLPGVRVVENVAGIGMTLAMGFAAEVLDSAGAPG